MKCKFCNKECKNKGSLAIHESVCKLNPNRDVHVCKFCGIEITNVGSNAKVHEDTCLKNPNRIDFSTEGFGRKAKSNGWECAGCGSIFRIRRDLEAHHKLCTEYIESINKNRQYDKHTHTCEYCGRELYTTKAGITNHLKQCKCNSNCVTHTMSTEQRELRSSIMKAKHQLGIAPTFADLRKTCEPSYPEKWLMKVIENENLNKYYTREYKFHTFSLDFAWVDDKAVIEVDGRFHKISDYQKDCDKRKDALLLQEGWRELRLDWEYCCNNTQEAILSIKDFLSQCVLTTQPFCKKVGYTLSVAPRRVKKKADIINKPIKQRRKVAKIVHNNKPKRYVTLVNEELKALRWSIIENSNIDFKKFGWVSEIAKLFNLTPQKAGAYIRKHFPEFYSTCFVRKHSM